MRVPFTPPQNQPKQLNANNTIRNTTPQAAANNFCFGPKSVVDVRRTPPSPTAGEFPAISEDIVLSRYSNDPLQLGDNAEIDNSEDWDSLIRELDLHDDFIPASKSIPQLPPEFPPFPSSDLTTQFLPSDFNVEFDFVDELIRLADSFETNSLQLAHVILARLNQRLRSPIGKPLQRAAFYFKEALQSLLTGSTRLTRSSTSSDVIQLIKAYKTFSNVSPIPMFSSFTANQAILDAVGGSMIVHVIDFDIGLGGHWASFMKEIADKPNPPLIRITAVVSEDYSTESRLIRENLSQFASELEIGFDIEFVPIPTFEILLFKAIKFVDGEKTAVLLSPMIFRLIGAGFVNDLRRILPHVVVHVDGEGLLGYGTSSFRQTIVDGLEFFSTVLESLEAADVGDGIRRIEMFVLVPNIFAAVEAAGRRVTPWRQAFIGAGLTPVGLSQFADSQAVCLLRRVQVRGFHVAKRQAEIVLCWHDKALVATSAWRC